MYFSKKIQENLVLIFPTYNTGGAEEVHLKIVQALTSQNPLVFFTRRSSNDHYYKDFADGAKVYDLSDKLNNPLIKWIYWGIIAGRLNRTSGRILFSACPDFYFITAFVKRREVLELVHMDIWADIKYFKFSKNINKRIFISEKVKLDIEKKYPSLKNNKNLVIESGLTTNKPFTREFNGILKFLYVGRGSIQKRVWLIPKIAKKCQAKNIPVEFNFIGEVEDDIPENLKKYCKFYGRIEDKRKIEAHYRQNHFLILTSDWEGFPVVIIEAMNNGVIPIVTDVGGIKYHIKNDFNGFLIKNTSEEQIIEDFVNLIQQLNKNRKDLSKISYECFDYVNKHFSITEFNRKYQALFK